MRLPSLALLVACTLYGSRAQALDPARSIRQYAHDVWSTKDGLPEGAVLALRPTRDGDLWLGTQCCLVRHDGDRFETFEEGRRGLPQYSFARGLLESEDGVLWAALVGGLARYSAGRFDVYAEAQGLAHPFVYALAKGPSGSVWVGTGGTGVWQFHSGAGFTRHPAYLRYPELPAKVSALAPGPRGELWVATDGGVLALGGDLLDPSVRRFSSAEGLPSPVANVLLVNSKGELWIGTRHGLVHTRAAEGSSPITAVDRVDDDVTALLEDRDENLWIGTRAGALLRRSGERIDRVESASSAGGVLALAEDGDGSLWVGTGGGLERYRSGAFVTAGREEGFPDEQILAVLARRAGGLWVLDGAGGLWVYEDGQPRRVAPRGTIAGDGMLGLFESEDGSLWAGGAELRRFHDDRWESYPHPGGDVTVIMGDGAALLLAQTTGEGTSTLWRFAGGAFAPVPVGVALTHVQRLYRDRRGRLWISTAGGLIRMAAEDSPAPPRVFRTLDGLPHDLVYGVEEDGAGDLWVATRSGLARIRGDVVTSFAESAGLPRRSPVHVKIDRAGHLWVTADDGIYRLSREALDALAEGRPAEPVEEKYTTRDGLRSVEISWRCSAQTETPDGRLVYATARGLSIVDPRRTAPISPPPRARIEELALGGRRAELARAASIGEGRERIEIRFGAPSLSHADTLEFRYRLEGYDPGWVEAHAARVASFTSVPPGDYVFRVAARQLGGAWSDQEASLALRIEPRWYETTAAHLALAAGLALLAVGLYRIRALQLRRRELVLVQRVETRTGELRREIADRRAAEEALGRLNDELEGRVRERTAQLYHRATHDALTGLPNRALLADRLEQAILRSRRAGGARFAVLFLDVDRFKAVNDSLGHLAGDQLIIQIAQRLRGCVGGLDTVTRLGGDEFAVIVAEIEGDDQGERAAERILEAMRAPFEIGESRVFTSVSIGITSSPSARGSAEDLLREADTAMYRAKAQGRARHQRFDPRMYEQAVERLRVEEGMRRALETGELELHYQPVISLAAGGALGAEALLRWRHPERGLLGPAAFLAIVEESGLIVEVSEWVIRVACEQAAAWQRQLSHPVRVHVNIPPQLLDGPRLVAQIRASLDRTGLAPAAFGIELVESTLVDGRASVIASLTELRAMGVHVAVDDFGTGYSSLSYLKRLPIDSLKIDQSFTRGIPRDASDTAICTTIVAMARSLSLGVVAEGVETREQLDFLIRSGCMAAQGYYFSRPLRAEECTRFLMAWPPGRAVERMDPLTEAGAEASSTP